MPLDDHPRSYSLLELQERCAHETSLFFRRKQNDPRYCFEIFRRAFVENNQEAWGVLYTQFWVQVAKWVRSNPGFKDTGEDEAYFINRSMEKFWKSNSSPAKFERFNSLDGVLKYLKLCVFSVITDHLRANRSSIIEYFPELFSISLESKSSLENEVFRKVEGQKFLTILRRRLKSEDEYWVMYASYYLNLKPAEIYDEMPDRFRNVKQIYRIKENLLARLRRDKELKEFWDDNAGEND